MSKIYILCIVFSVLLQFVQCDDLLFAVEFTTPGFYYPEVDVFDWARNKSLHISNAGLRQQYLLGRELRKRYIDDAKLISERHDIFNRAQIRIRTTADPQTVSSCYAQLMGLYIPGSGDFLTANEIVRAVPPNAFDFSVWTEELETAALNYTYQTIPLEQNGGVADRLLSSEKYCKSVTDLVNSAIKKNPEKHQTLYNTIADALGVSRERIKNVKEASEMRYALILSVAEGRPPNGDLEKAYKIYNETKEIDRLYMYESMLNIISGKKDVTKIITTPVLREVLSSFEKAIGAQSPLRFILYSIEVPLLLGLLRQLDFQVDLAEHQTASALLLELYKNSTNLNNTEISYYFKISYDKQEKVIPSEKFTQDIRSKILDEVTYNNLCSDSSSDDGFTVNWIFIVAIGGGVLVIGLIILAVCLIRHKCKGGDSDSEAENKILAALQNRLNLEGSKEE